MILIIISCALPSIGKAAVVINEIAWMGTENSANDEWIELYSDEETDLSGWIIEAADGSPIINLEGNISSNSYFLLERTDDQTVPEIAADQLYTGALGNSGENLKLKNSNNDIIDEVNCDEEWFAGNNSTKQTMEKISNGWQSSLNSGGTPGSQNSSGSIEIIEPEEATPPELPEQFIKNTSSNIPPIADAGENVIAFIDEEIIFDGSASNDPDGNDLAYEWNLGEGGVKNDIIVTHKYSYSGTYLVTLMVFDGRYYSKDTITVEIYPKKITINEFLPSPTGKDAEEEWIELYNDSDSILGLGGWQLDDDEGGSKPFIFPENTLIAPKNYLVFSRQATGIALNNDSDKVRLLLSNGAVFQEIAYEKAKEEQSSARTPEGFVWSIPTPGLPNIIGADEPIFNYNNPLQSEITKDSQQNTNLSYDDFENSSQKNLSQDKKQNYYNLANISESTDNNSKLFLIIITIIIVICTAGAVILKFKKK